MGISHLEIKAKYGDLRLRATWEKAYSEYTYERFPLIQAIAQAKKHQPQQPEPEAQPKPQVTVNVGSVLARLEKSSSTLDLVGGGGKTFVSATGNEKVPHLFIKVDARYGRCAWICQELRPSISVKNSGGGLFCRQVLKTRTNINHNYRYPFKVYAKASDVMIARERPPPYCLHR